MGAGHAGASRGEIALLYIGAGSEVERVGGVTNGRGALVETPSVGNAKPGATRA